MLYKHLQMPRYGVSENGIGCKDSENNDKLYVFRGLFSWLNKISYVKVH